MPTDTEVLNAVNELMLQLRDHIATIGKTADIDILTHQLVTHPGTAKGSAQDVSTKLAAKLFLFHASVEAAANTNPGRFLVLTSASASGNDDWVTDYEFDATISTADTELMDAVEGAGETVLAVSSTAGFAAYDKLYIQDVTTLANSEWRICQEIDSNVSITIVDGLTKAKAINDVIWNDADIFTLTMDLTSVVRLRVLFMHEGAAGCNCHVMAKMSTGDSIA